MTARKFVSIQVHGEGVFFRLFAIAEDGTAWTAKNHSHTDGKPDVDQLEWLQIKNLPAYGPRVAPKAA